MAVEGEQGGVERSLRPHCEPCLKSARNGGHYTLRKPGGIFIHSLGAQMEVSKTKQENP